MIIHGYTGGPYEVEPLKEYLQAQTDWELYVPTLPGHGRELALDGVLYEEWLEEAESRLQAMKKKYTKVYLIGFSMGGMIASYLAAQTKINKLVLLAPACKYISPKHWLINTVEVLRDLIKGNLHNNRLYKRYRRKVGAIPLQANVQFAKLISYTRNYLKDIQAPVFIVHGLQDDVVPLRATKYVYEKIGSKEKTAVLFADSDHHLCLGADQAQLNQMVYQFLTKKDIEAPVSTDI